MVGMLPKNESFSLLSGGICSAIDHSLFAPACSQMAWFLFWIEIEIKWVLHETGAVTIDDELQEDIVALAVRYI